MLDTRIERCYYNSMNEIQIYSAVMFFAGVLVTKAVFYFEQKQKTKRFYIIMSAAVLQILDSIHSSHLAALEYAESELKKIEISEETKTSEYLEKENQKVSLLMEVYTLLLIRAIPEKGRKFVNYKSWSEASILIEKLRGLSKDEKNRG